MFELITALVVTLASPVYNLASHRFEPVNDLGSGAGLDNENVDFLDLIDDINRLIPSAQSLEWTAKKVDRFIEKHSNNLTLLN